MNEKIKVAAQKFLFRMARNHHRIQDPVSIINDEETDKTNQAIQFNENRLLKRQYEHLVFRNSALIQIQNIIDMIFSNLDDLPYQYYNRYDAIGDQIDRVHDLFELKLQNNKTPISLVSLYPATNHSSFSYIQFLHQQYERIEYNAIEIEKQLRKFMLQSQIILDEQTFSYLHFTTIQQKTFDKLLDNTDNLMLTLRYY